MLDKNIYKRRRENLKSKMKSGVILFLGNEESLRNYPGYPYHFRQDSSFLYFFGHNIVGLSALIDIDENKEYLFGNDYTIEDEIWMGHHPPIKDLAEQIGIKNIGTTKQLNLMVKDIISKKLKLHFLPPYRATAAVKLEELTGISSNRIKEYSSLDLIRAIVNLRSIKSEEEIIEIENALKISEKIYAKVYEMAQPGIHEQEIVGKINGITRQYNSFFSFPIIVTKNGKTLHNSNHSNLLTQNDLLLVDSGVESENFYSSDITRTYPVGHKFTQKQKDIYSIVLNSQKEAIANIKPEVLYKDIHIIAAKVIAFGLKDLGLMQGNIDDAVASGAHALFYPHGLGHMLGLDAHDMEDLGEDNVGYDDTIKRSEQFGLAFLRMAKKIEKGFVLTVEPGIYFIPTLINLWKSQNKFKEFINYKQVEKYIDFEGIRIEDDVVVAENGARLLGNPIPKNIDEIEI